jgi:hypothetical protein
MGFDSHKLFVYLFVMIVTVPVFSYAEQYYDPVTRRYIQKNPVVRKPIRPLPNQYSLPTQQEQLEEEQRLQQLRDSSGTQARRRFDPNRYHRTEDITIAPF